MKISFLFHDFFRDDAKLIRVLWHLVSHFCQKLPFMRRVKYQFSPKPAALTYGYVEREQESISFITFLMSVAWQIYDNCFDIILHLTMSGGKSDLHDS